MDLKQIRLSNSNQHFLILFVLFWIKTLGEKKNRSLRRNEIISKAERCVYCDSLETTTVEHMPPRGIFEGGTRPSGWEFASCANCNESTRRSDAVAQFFAMLSVFDLPDWKGSKIRKLPGALKAHAPGFIEEVFGTRPWEEKLLQKNGLLRPVKVTRADGPVVKQHLDRFSTKISMAGFAHLVERPMKTDGVIFLQWFLNGGMNLELYEAITQIMPVHGQIKQGRKTSGEQFFFRYNTDMKNIVAAIYTFHNSLSILSIATDGDEFIEPISDLFSADEIKDRETANLVFSDIARWRPVNQTQ